MSYNYNRNFNGAYNNGGPPQPPLAPSVQPQNDYQLQQLLARIQALEIDNAQLRNKLIETNEECFNLQATMVANEVEVKHMASVELEKVQSELSFKKNQFDELSREHKKLMNELVDIRHRQKPGESFQQSVKIESVKKRRVEDDLQSISSRTGSSTPTATNLNFGGNPRNNYSTEKFTPYPPNLPSLKIPPTAAASSGSRGGTRPTTPAAVNESTNPLPNKENTPLHENATNPITPQGGHVVTVAVNCIQKLQADWNEVLSTMAKYPVYLTVVVAEENPFQALARKAYKAYGIPSATNATTGDQLAQRISNNLPLTPNTSKSTQLPTQPTPARMTPYTFAQDPEPQEQVEGKVQPLINSMSGALIRLHNFYLTSWTQAEYTFPFNTADGAQQKEEPVVKDPLRVHSEDILLILYNSMMILNHYLHIWQIAVFANINGDYGSSGEGEKKLPTNSAIKTNNNINQKEVDGIAGINRTPNKSTQGKSQHTTNPVHLSEETMSMDENKIVKMVHIQHVLRSLLHFTTQVHVQLLSLLPPGTLLILPKAFTNFPKRKKAADKQQQQQPMSKKETTLPLRPTASINANLMDRFDQTLHTSRNQTIPLPSSSASLFSCGELEEDYDESCLELLASCNIEDILRKNVKMTIKYAPTDNNAKNTCTTTPTPGNSNLITKTITVDDIPYDGFSFYHSADVLLPEIIQQKQPSKQHSSSNNINQNNNDDNENEEISPLSGEYTFAKRQALVEEYEEYFHHMIESIVDVWEFILTSLLPSPVALLSKFYQSCTPPSSDLPSRVPCSMSAEEEASLYARLGKNFPIPEPELIPTTAEPTKPSAASTTKKKTKKNNNKGINGHETVDKADDEEEDEEEEEIKELPPVPAEKQLRMEDDILYATITLVSIMIRQYSDHPSRGNAHGKYHPSYSASSASSSSKNGKSQQQHHYPSKFNYSQSTRQLLYQLALGTDDHNNASASTATNDAMMDVADEKGMQLASEESILLPSCVLRLFDIQSDYSFPLIFLLLGHTEIMYQQKSMLMEVIAEIVCHHPRVYDLFYIQQTIPVTPGAMTFYPQCHYQYLRNKPFETNDPIQNAWLEKLAIPIVPTSCTIQTSSASSSSSNNNKNKKKDIIELKPIELWFPLCYSLVHHWSEELACIPNTESRKGMHSHPLYEAIRYFERMYGATSSILPTSSSSTKLTEEEIIIRFDALKVHDKLYRRYDTQRYHLQIIYFLQSLCKKDPQAFLYTLLRLPLPSSSSSSSSSSKNKTPTELLQSIDRTILNKLCYAWFNAWKLLETLDFTIAKLEMHLIPPIIWSEEIKTATFEHPGTIHYPDEQQATTANTVKEFTMDQILSFVNGIGDYPESEEEERWCTSMDGYTPRERQYAVLIAWQLTLLVNDIVGSLLASPLATVYLNTKQSNASSAAATAAVPMEVDDDDDLLHDTDDEDDDDDLGVLMSTSRRKALYQKQMKSSNTNTKQQQQQQASETKNEKQQQQTGVPENGIGKFVVLRDCMIYINAFMIRYIVRTLPEALKNILNPSNVEHFDAL